MFSGEDVGLLKWKVIFIFVMMKWDEQYSGVVDCFYDNVIVFFDMIDLEVL